MQLSLISIVQYGVTLQPHKLFFFLFEDLIIITQSDVMRFVINRTIYYYELVNITNRSLLRNILLFDTELQMTTES